MGTWGGMIGGLIVQTLVLIWVTFTDWNKEEVEQARTRLNKWEHKKKTFLSVYAKKSYYSNFMRIIC
ncbi:unnamed protein product [Urochloa humidicola]